MVTCLGCGNVVSPSNQMTVIVVTINKQVKQPLWHPLLFVQGHLCPPIAHYVQTLGNLSGFCPDFVRCPHVNLSSDYSNLMAIHDGTVYFLRMKLVPSS